MKKLTIPRDKRAKAQAMKDISKEGRNYIFRQSLVKQIPVMDEVGKLKILNV